MSLKKARKKLGIEEFETLLPLIETLHSDFKELTRKNQNAPLSKARIDMINRLLSRAKSLLDGEPSRDFLDLMDEDLVPQNADAVLMLGQYAAALNRFRQRYAVFDELLESWRWSEAE